MRAPLSPRRCGSVRGLYYPLFAVGTSHGILSIGPHLSQAHAIRGYSNFQSSMRLAFCGLNAAYDITVRADTQGGI